MSEHCVVGVWAAVARRLRELMDKFALYEDYDTFADGASILNGPMVTCEQDA